MAGARSRTGSRSPAAANFKIDAAIARTQSSAIGLILKRPFQFRSALRDAQVDGVRIGWVVQAIDTAVELASR